MSGTVATGAAFAGAQIKAVDKTGATVCDTTVAADGTYSCELAAGVQTPIVISAIKDDIALYSVKAMAGSATINVTPITTILASRLAPNGDPAALAGAMQADPGLLDAAKVEDQLSQVIALLKPLLDALGDAVNPLTGAFSVGGSHDHVLDAIQVTVLPDGTAANIDVTVKAAPSGEGAAPMAVSFRSSDTGLPTLPPVTSQQLAPADSQALLDGLVARATACWALPLSQRVNAADDSVNVVGGPLDVKADVCKSIFLNNDPSTYLNFGFRVGRNASNAGAFTGMYRPGATNAVFSNAVARYLLPNGDAYMSFRVTDTLGNVQFSAANVRFNNGVAQFIGNQYAYDASVSPSLQQRDFINREQYSYLNVGYDVSIPNVLDGTGNTIFSKVLVTAPNGTVYTFGPTVGNNSMRMKRGDGSSTNTSIVRLNAAFKNPATAGHPATLESQLVYVDPLYTEEQIIALPHQGSWRFEFFHVNTATPNVVQYARTLQRAFTIAEAKQAKLAGITDVSRAHFQGLTGQSGYFTFSTPPSATSPNRVQLGTSTADFWQVPQGAVAPTSVTIYGYKPVNGVQGPQFDDSVTVSAAARTATIFCTLATAQDTHCDTSTGVPQYGSQSIVNYIQMFGRNEMQVGFLSAVALYFP